MVEFTELPTSANKYCAVGTSFETVAASTEVAGTTALSALIEAPKGAGVTSKRAVSDGERAKIRLLPAMITSLNNGGDEENGGHVDTPRLAGVNFRSDPPTEGVLLTQYAVVPSGVNFKSPRVP